MRQKIGNIFDVSKYLGNDFQAVSMDRVLAYEITLEAEIWHATKVHKYRMIQDVWDICEDNICQKQQPIMDFENGLIVKIYKS